MADWDPVQTAPVAAPVQAPMSTPPATQSMGFTPVSGQKNAMMPPGIRVVASAPPKPKADSTAATWRAATDAEKKQFPGAAQISSRGEVKYAPASSETADLSPDSTDVLSDKYLADGSLPNTGMGGAGIKVAIINKAAEKLKALGLNGTDAIAQSAGYKANAAALTDSVKRRTQVASYEGTVEDSIELAQQYADKALANTGFGTINKGVNWYKDETGDPQYKGLKDAVQTVTNEYAKVISNSTNGGVTSDAARAHAAEMLSAADSPQAFKEAVKVLKQEMSFRINSMDRQIAGLSHTLHTALGSNDQDGSGDHAAYVRAFQQKNGTVQGAEQQWQQYKRTSPDTPWRQAFPQLKPEQAAPVVAPATGSAKVRKWNPQTGALE